MGQSIAGSGEGWAGLRMVNALDVGRAELTIRFNGRPWSDSSLQAGEVGALRRIRPGVHHVECSREGLVKCELKLKVKAGDLITLVPHARKLESGWAIQVLRIMARDTHGARMASMVNVGPGQPLWVEIKQMGKSWAPLPMRPYEWQRFAIIQPRGYLPIRVDKQPLASMPVFEKGHHVVVIYGLAAGGVAALSYRDRGWPNAEDSAE